MPAPRSSPGRPGSRRALPVTGVPLPKIPPNQNRLGGRRLAGENQTHLPPVVIPEVVVEPPATVLARATALARGTGELLLGGAPTGVHPLELAGLLHELSDRLLTAADLTTTLHRLAEFTARSVPGVLRSSVTLISDGEPLTLVGSGPVAQAVDELQYVVGQGPGLDAARTRAVVMSQDLPGDERWPDLADQARADAVHSVVALPLDVQRTSVGSLTLFVARPAGILPELLLTTMAIVSQAEILLAEHGRRSADARTATVDHAVGVIIAQRGCGVREAYDILRDTAQRLGIDREAVAERLVTAAARNAASITREGA